MLIIERKKVVTIVSAIAIALVALGAFITISPKHRMRASKMISNFSLINNTQQPKYHDGETVKVNANTKEARKLRSSIATNQKDNPIKKGKNVVIHHKDGSVETISKGATVIEPPKMKANDPHIMSKHHGVWSVKRGDKTYTASSAKLQSLRDELKVPRNRLHLTEEALFNYYIYAQEHHTSFKKAYEIMGSPNSDL